MTVAIPKLVADFETTTDPLDTRVWSWGMDTLKRNNWVYGIDIKSFMDHISKFKSIIYFHNLKFDATFMMDWLLKNGYTHSTQRNLKSGQFSTLISDMGFMYSMKVSWLRGQTTEFRDSLKKFPNMSVQRIAKTFKLPISKGDIDYHSERPVGYQPTPEEWDYVKRDVHIICHALEATFDAGMTKLTVGSDALSDYKAITGKANYGLLFPVFGQHMDTEIRRAYRGGFTYADPRFSGRVIGGGVVLDVNSLYPYVMYDRLIPYGTPNYSFGRVEATPARPLTIFSVTFTAKLKHGHIPCIQIKGNSQFSATEYLTEIKEPTELMVTNVDWDLYQEHYDINILHYGGGWSFMATKGMFADYIDKWSKVKAESTGGKRELAKLNLNSLYGKFASRTQILSKVPHLEDDRVKYHSGVEDTKSPVYTPAGVFITSWARDLTIRAAQTNYDVFAYADTDSLHLLTPEPPANIHIHPTDLGAWKREYDFDAALYIRAKAYLERHGASEFNASMGIEPGTYTTRIAGLPTSVSEKLTFADCVDGAIFHGKLSPRAVPGGLVLVDVPYKLKM